VVQPVLALGLVVLLGLARAVLGERVGPRERIAVGLVVIGVVAVSLAAPGRSDVVHSRGALAAMVAALSALALAPYLRRGSARAGLAVASAASGDALAAIALKLVADDIAIRHWGVAIAWIAVAGLAGVAALTAEMSALQAVPASHVAPVIVGTQVVVPAAAGVLVFGERLGGTPLGGAVVIAGIAVTAAGAALLGASRGVGNLMLGRPEPEAGAHDAGRGG
jgi:drug/metabolite transporter (DMT)-like permease